MKLAIFTNIASLYQISLGQAFADYLPGNFSLVCWEPVHEERVELGWKNDFDRDWLIRAWKSQNESQKAQELLYSADIAICGYAPAAAVNNRITRGQLTFRYTERPFKLGRWRILDPRVFKDVWTTYHLSNHKAYHLPAVGPHCANDFKSL